MPLRKSPFNAIYKLKANEASSMHYTYIRLLERSNCQYVYHFHSLFFSSSNKNTRNNYYYTTNNHSGCPLFFSSSSSPLHCRCTKGQAQAAAPWAALLTLWEYGKTISLFNLWLFWAPNRYDCCVPPTSFISCCFGWFWVSARQKAKCRRKMGTFFMFWPLLEECWALRAGEHVATLEIFAVWNRIELVAYTNNNNNLTKNKVVTSTNSSHKRSSSFFSRPPPLLFACSSSCSPVECVHNGKPFRERLKCEAKEKCLKMVKFV